MPDHSAAHRSRCRRDSLLRSAGRGNGSSRRGYAAPVPARAGLRYTPPAGRQSPPVARPPRAAIFRRPMSSGRRRRSSAAACPRPLADPAESPYLRPWRARTPLASDDPASATKSYANPTVYIAPASAITRPRELSRLIVKLVRLADLIIEAWTRAQRNVDFGQIKTQLHEILTKNNAEELQTKIGITT